jgi:hypothetical protein
MAMEEGPLFEERRQNVLEALDAARIDWIDATDPIEEEIQLTAIDHLLDLAIDYGYLAVQGIDKARSV